MQSFLDEADFQYRGAPCHKDDARAQVAHQVSLYAQFIGGLPKWLQREPKRWQVGNVPTVGTEFPADVGARGVDTNGSESGVATNGAGEANRGLLFSSRRWATPPKVVRAGEDAGVDSSRCEVSCRTNVSIATQEQHYKCTTSVDHL